MVMFGLMTKGEFALWLVMVVLAVTLFLGFYRAIRAVQAFRKISQEQDKQL